MMVISNNNIMYNVNTMFFNINDLNLYTRNNKYKAAIIINLIQYSQ